MSATAIHPFLAKLQRIRPTTPIRPLRGPLKLTVVARKLGVSRREVDRLIAAGKLKTMRVGSRKKVLFADVERLQAKRRA